MERCLPRWESLLGGEAVLHSVSLYGIAYDSSSLYFRIFYPALCSEGACYGGVWRYFIPIVSLLLHPAKTRFVHSVGNSSCSIMFSQKPVHDFSISGAVQYLRKQAK